VGNRAEFGLDVNSREGVAALAAFAKASEIAAKESEHLEKQMHASGRGMSAMAASFGGNLLANAAGQAAGAAASFGKSALQITVARDTMREAFKSMLGSAKEADRAMSLIRAAGSKPGLTFDVATSGVQRMLGTGMNLSTAVKMVELFGNAAAGSGVSVERMEQAMLGFSQMLAKGKVEQEDLNQVLEPMPALGTKIVAVFGAKTGEAMNKSIKSADDLAKKWMQVFSMMPKAPDALANALLNLDNATKDLKASFGEALIGDKAQGSITTLAKSIEDLKPLASSVGAWVRRTLTGIGDELLGIWSVEKYTTRKEQFAAGLRGDLSGLIQLGHERRLAAKYGTIASQDPIKTTMSGLLGPGFDWEADMAKFSEAAKTDADTGLSKKAAEAAEAAAAKAAASERVKLLEAKDREWRAKHGGAGGVRPGDIMGRADDGAGHVAVVGKDGAVYENTSANRSRLRGAEQLGPHTWRIPMDSYQQLGYGAYRVYDDANAAGRFANEAEWLARNPGGKLLDPGKCAALANRAARAAGLPQWMGTGSDWIRSGSSVSGGGTSPFAGELAVAKAAEAKLGGAAAVATLAAEKAEDELRRRDVLTDMYIRRVRSAIEAGKAGDMTMIGRLREGGWGVGETIVSAVNELDRAMIEQARRKDPASLDEVLADITKRKADEAKDAAEAAAKRREEMWTGLGDQADIAGMRAQLAPTQAESEAWTDKQLAFLRNQAAGIAGVVGKQRQYYELMLQIKRIEDDRAGRLTRGQELLHASLGGGQGLARWAKAHGGSYGEVGDNGPMFDFARYSADKPYRGDVPSTATDVENGFVAGLSTMLGPIGQASYRAGVRSGEMLARAVGVG